MKIEISSRVIKHLGKDLITSSDVAVVELVKNSIDAQAEHINLKIYDMIPSATCLPAEIVSQWIPSELAQLPLLIVEDDGCGMTDEQLQKGFLTVGTDIKEGDGTLLGAKGIGRLATQRLGQAVLLETCAETENHSSYVFIHWAKVIEGENELPYLETEKSESHTRLWIFGANLNDYIENAAQFEQQTLLPNYYVAYPNRDLKTALSFLISPFLCVPNNNPVTINVFYRDQPIDFTFPTEMISLAESCHTFALDVTSDSIKLNCKLSLQPWFVERVHRALVKPSAFERLKQPHDYYQELLNRNADRVHAALTLNLNQDELTYFIIDMLRDLISPFGKGEEEVKQYEAYLASCAKSTISALRDIIPISGAIYSFKQGVAVGEKIAIDSAISLGIAERSITLTDLKRFLDDNNGIKLYRGKYRIGFLGNKESDWIKLQQFRTKGQQWYRFDLGNTVGYVSLNDMSQTKIQEISSRLDISQNEFSDAFKTCINLIFNYYFYDLNRKANDIIKVLLEEDGKLGDSLGKRIKKNDNTLRRLQANNKKLQKQLEALSSYVSTQIKVDGDAAVIPASTYNYITDSIAEINDAVIAERDMHEETAVLMREASEQLQSIEIEAYNNFKLMANGMITETITHELDSISKTSISPDAEKHFDALRQCLVEMNAVRMYNLHLYPIRNNYDVISSKLEQIGSMYGFLETTFIRKGSYDVFIMQNIDELVEMVKKNLFQSSPIKDVDIVTRLDGLVWTVPKGVLLHIFYNLFSNSLYWIDTRRKWAQSDKNYMSIERDQILVEAAGDNDIIVSDTGTGVIRNMEDILFEPLESGKKAEERRGMGLYIVQKLMQSFGGDIELLDDRNMYGNRYRFLLTLKAQEG